MGRHSKNQKRELSAEDYIDLEKLLSDGWSFRIAMSKIGFSSKIIDLVKDDKIIEKLRLKYCPPASTRFLKKRLGIPNEIN